MSGTAKEAAEAVMTKESTRWAPTRQPAKDAFSELMTSKKQKPPSSSSSAAASKSAATKILSSDEQRHLNISHGRGALAVYTESPTSFPPTRVLSHDDAFVTINDLYPKSSIHLLLLPRDKSKQLLHPFDALDGSDPEFLAAVKAETARLRALAASDLRRRYGRFSAQDAARNAALDGCGEGDALEALPPGRDWSRDIICGVHAVPSMTHLHIHVLSVDRVNECVKHKKHYNSFATPFLVPVDDFPLAADDPRRHPGREGYLERELTCWRCGEGFGNRFEKFKNHLAEELELWKRS